MYSNGDAAADARCGQTLTWKSLFIYIKPRSISALKLFLLCYNNHGQVRRQVSFTFSWEAYDRSVLLTDQ